MAKKFKIFSELILGAAAAFTLGYAANIKPAAACEGDTAGQTNCAEVISPAPVSEDDIYADADTKIDSERNVSHSFFLAGNEVASKDRIDGIHFLAGNLVDFTGSAEYGAFAGNSLKVNGEIDKDLFVAGSSIELGEDALIGRDLYAAATTVLIKTNLAGNAFVSGSRVVLENVTISGDLHLAAEEVTIKGKVSISGTFEYNDNARVVGMENLSYGESKTYIGSNSKIDLSFATSLTTKFILLLGRLLVTIIFIAIAGKLSKRMLDEFKPKSAWKDIALGLGLLIVVPLAVILTMVTIIGLPLGLIGIAFYILFAYFSTSVTGLVIGDQLAKYAFKNEKLHPFLKATMGIVLLFALGFVPYVGGLISAISTCFGFGYLVHKIFRQPKTAKK